MYEKDLVYTDYKVVEPSCLLDYLPDPEEPVAFHATPRLPGEPHAPDDWDVNHMAYSEENFAGSGVPFASLYRGALTNQMMMRFYQHNNFHRAHVRNTQRPAVEVMGEYVRENQILSQIAIASFALSLNKPAEELPENMLSIAPIATSAEKIEFFENVRTYNLNRVRNIDVIPFTLVTSAVLRIGLMLGDAELQSFASARIAKDPQVFPLKMPRLASLRKQAGNTWASHEEALLEAEAA